MRPQQRRKPLPASPPESPPRRGLLSLRVARPELAAGTSPSVVQAGCHSGNGSSGIRSVVPLLGVSRLFHLPAPDQSVRPSTANAGWTCSCRFVARLDANAPSSHKGPGTPAPPWQGGQVVGFRTSRLSSTNIDESCSFPRV